MRLFVFGSQTGEKRRINDEGGGGRRKGRKERKDRGRKRVTQIKKERMKERKEK